MKIITKFLLLTSIVSALNSNVYSTENNNEQYNSIEQQNNDSISSNEINEQINNDQKFNNKCILEYDEYLELNKTLRAINMPLQFINVFTKTDYIVNWIKENFNLTSKQLESCSKFLYTICDHKIQLIDLLTNPSNTNMKVHKPLNKVTVSLIESFEVFYHNMLNHLWIRVILSDSNFDKYTKNIKINQNLIKKINDMQINKVLNYYENKYADYYTYFQVILEE